MILLLAFKHSNLRTPQVLFALGSRTVHKHHHFFLSLSLSLWLSLWLLLLLWSSSSSAFVVSVTKTHYSWTHKTQPFSFRWHAIDILCSGILDKLKNSY